MKWKTNVKELYPLGDNVKTWKEPSERRDTHASHRLEEKLKETKEAIPNEAGTATGDK